MKKEKAIIYTRTSSATNFGDNKDSVQRQVISCQSFANSNNLKIEKTFSDVISGTVPIYDRPEFIKLLEFSAEHNINKVIIETADRFARDTLVMLLGVDFLKKEKIEVLASDGNNLMSDDPTSKLIRNVMASMSEWVKETTVIKLRMARKRKKLQTKSKVEGRKGYADKDKKLIEIIHDLRRKNKTLEEISKKLEKLGYFTSNGTPLGTSQISRLSRLQSITAKKHLVLPETPKEQAEVA